MTLGRTLLLTSERKKFRLLLTIATFVTVVIALRVMGGVHGYRYFDLIVAPVFVFASASQLGSAKAMDDIWFALSPGIVVTMLCVTTLFGFIEPFNDAILRIPKEGFFVGIIAMAVLGEGLEDARSLGTVLRIGYGLGFGIRFGFVFGFLAFGLLAIGFYVGAILGSIFTLRFWKRLRDILHTK